MSQLPKQINDLIKSAQVETVGNKENFIDSPIEEETQNESWSNNKVHKWTKLTLKDGEVLNVPRHYTVGGMTQRLINASDDGFASILITGISSSGKTSLVRNIMHKIHTTPNYPQFTFKWLHSEDLVEFDKFLQSLEAGLNYFVVLDDASFVADAEGASKNTMAKIGLELTRVRHNLKGGRIIVCIINHALTSVQKSVFRNSTFTIATSMVSNAKKGLIDLFGNPYMINGYATHYRNQVLNHKVRIPISSYERKFLNLDTKKVRIGLVQEVNWLHYFLWEDVSCEICNQDYYQKKESKYETPLTPSHFLAQVNKIYGIQNLASTIRWFHYIRTGDASVLHANQRKHLRLINNLAQKCDFDFKGVVDKLDERRKKKRAKKRWVTEEEKQIESELMEVAKQEPFNDYAEIHPLEDK